ncbi:MAG: hypothetical protein NVSMB62_04620 [Acidobacteriaceae bacterium]
MAENNANAADTGGDRQEKWVMSDPLKQHRPGNLIAGEDVVSTPEGDNEYAPDQPVGPTDGLQVPRGSLPIPYDSDVEGGSGDDGIAKVDSDSHEKGEVEKTVDKLSLGQILT